MWDMVQLEFSYKQAMYLYFIYCECPICALVENTAYTNIISLSRLCAAPLCKNTLINSCEKLGFESSYEWKSR